jgi:predicted  nucleic acid-binding Zn-ribbon protein
MNPKPNKSDEENETSSARPGAIQCDGGLEIDRRSAPPESSACRINIQNLGGIDTMEQSISPGVSILVGRNATNRSSMLRSLAAGLGGRDSAARLKSDADSGQAQLSISNETYTREYTRNGQTIQKQGDPYTTESNLVDTFVALFADCPARRAVEQDENLREILMKPVDTAEIRTQISELKQRRSKLEDTIQRAENRKNELPQLEEKRGRLEDDLEDVEEEITELESVVEEIESTADESSETAQLRDELESLRDELSNAERRADEIHNQLEFRRDERASLSEERDELESELEGNEQTTTLESEIEELESEIAELSNRQGTIEQAAEDLQSVIQANETFLDGDVETVGLTDGDSVTDALDPDSQTVECWTCGSEVEQAEISERIATLRELVAQHRTEMNEIGGQITELRREKARLEERFDEHEEMTRRLGELDNRIDQHDDKIQQLETDHKDKQAEIEELNDEIAAVEAEIEEAETDNEETTEFVDAHKELTKLERKRGRLENQLEETVDDIEEIEALDEKRADAEERRAALTDELENLRGRIDQLETELVETLNSIMEDLIDRLEYDTIARVWLERQTSDDNSDSTFELHIVREAEDGSVYEDTAATLSESEREVIGLVVALAGYLVHDVDREVPFLLLDSVEMIDGQRLADLLKYIQERTEVEFLSVALLPKDAQSVKEAEVFDEYAILDFDPVSA